MKKRKEDELMKQRKWIIGVILSVVLIAMIGAVPASAQNLGSITINNTVKDKDYDVYRIFDLTYNGDKVSYTIADKFEAFFSPSGAGANYITANDSGGLNPIVVNGVIRYINITEDNVAQMAQDALAYAAQLTPDAHAVGTSGDVTLDGLPLGYYLVYPRGASTQNQNSSGSICSLTSTTPSATVNIKADYPTLDKTIDENGGVQENTASIGDNVPYRITGRVPDMTGFTKYYYIVTDTMSKGLTFNEDTAITIGDTPLTQNVDYTVNVTIDADGVTEIEVVFKDFIRWQSVAGKTISVTYSATVNQDAVIGMDPNTNKAVLVYSNDPLHNPAGDPEDPDKPGDVIGQTPQVQTNTYVAQIEITKVDGADPTQTLTGAKFKIAGTGKHVVVVNGEIYSEDADGEYYRLKDGTYTTTPPVTKPDGSTAHLYDSTTVKYSKINVINMENADLTTIVSEGYVDSNGKLTFTGLGEGTYTITELVAPDGYNLITTPITVQITFENGAWEYNIGEGAAQISADGRIRMNIENRSGIELPGTGGKGTILFYVIGGVLVVGAVVLLAVNKGSKKRKNPSPNDGD